MECSNKAKMMSKKEKHKVLLFFVITFSVFDYSNSVLTGYEGANDITAIHEFGCRWLGGSISALECVCQPGARELYIQKDTISAYSTNGIKIADCDSVRFGKNAILDVRNLRNIELKNIGALHFEDSSLTWEGYAQNTQYYGSWERNTPGLRILIEDSTIREMSSYTFKGRIKEITFRRVVVANMSSFAISSLIQCQNIELIDSDFRDIHQQAFKKIATDSLLIEGSRFDVLPSRAFSDIEISQNFLIRQSYFNNIKPGAFLITKPKRFEVTNSRFNLVEGDSFKINMRGSVLFQNNTFNKTNDGAFRGITLNQDDIEAEQQIAFISNTFYSLEKGSLAADTSSFTAKYENVLLNQKCECTTLEWVFPDSDYHQSFSCLYENEKVTVKEFKKYNCSVLESYASVIIIVGVVLILAILIITALVVYYKRVYKGTKQKEYLTDNNGKPIGLIMPDGRTYRETELHVIVERTDLLTTDL